MRDRYFELHYVKLRHNALMFVKFESRNLDELTKIHNLQKRIMKITLALHYHVVVKIKGNPAGHAIFKGFPPIIVSKLYTWR